MDEYHQIAPLTGPDRSGKPLPPSLHTGTEPLMYQLRPRGGPLLIPALICRRHRPHVLAFHRFVLLINGIADNPLTEAEAKIHQINTIEHALLEGKTRQPWLQPVIELKKSLKKSNVKDHYARQILHAGRHESLRYTYKNWKELIIYCHYAAAPIGRYILELHEQSLLAAAQASDALFTAIRILGSLQDCRRDWANLGRTCIPRQWFDDAAISPERLVERSCDTTLRTVIDRLLLQTDGLLDHSRTLLPAVKDWRLRTSAAALLMEALALRRHLGRVDPLAGRTNISFLTRAAAISSGVALAAKIR